MLYAPWIHEDVVVCTDDSLETVFFLLILDSVTEYNLYVYYLVYTKDDASSAIMCRATASEQHYRFSVNAADNIWDEKQWGEEYTKPGIPECCHSDRLSTLFERIDRIAPSIHQIINPHKHYILQETGDGSLSPLTGNTDICYYLLYCEEIITLIS